MKKLYTMLWCVLAMLLLLSKTSSAQYSVNSYSVIGNTDPWQSLNGGTEITECEPNANDPLSSQFSVVSNDITLPFNFRFINTVTNKIKVLGMSGSVIAGGSDSWPDNQYYDYYGCYQSTVFQSQINNWTTFNGKTAGLGANNIISAFSCFFEAGWPGLTKHFYQVQGSAPYRRVVVETDNGINYYAWLDKYLNTTTYQTLECSGSWQIVIYEGSSFLAKYQLNYGPFTYGTATNNVWGFNYIFMGVKETGGNVMQIYRDPQPANGANASTTGAASINYPSAAPTVNYTIAIRYPYNVGWRDVQNPVNQSIVLVNAPFTPIARLSNEGQNAISTPVSVSASIQRVGDPVTYTQSVPATGTQIPNPQGGIGTSISFPTYTPTQYGMYVMTLTVSNSQDLYSQDNVMVDTFIVSPPNNIAGIQVLSPPNNSSMPIGYPLPITIRFRNIGASAQSNVPVSAYIVNPLGQVVYRDTLVVGQWPSGYVLDSSFLRSFVPTLKGMYQIFGVALMSTDQNRPDDTTKSRFNVTFLSDVMAAKIIDPDDQAEKPEKKRFAPIVFFQNVGAQDLFDVPVRLQIRRCSDNVLVFQADSILPELNIDQGQVKFSFPAKQGTYDIASLAAGCYKLCAIARQGDDGDHSNDTICQFFSILPRLKGDYYVGIGRNFQTISNAVDTMRFRGIGGPVRMILTDNNYSENGNTTSSSLIAAIEMRNIDGLGETSAAGTSTVTWKPLANVFPTITFSGNKPNCILYSYQSANYMTWDGNNQVVVTPDALTAEPSKRAMTIVNQSSAPGSVFGFEYGRHDLKLKNLNIINNGNLANGSSAAIRMSNIYNTASFLFARVTDTSEMHHIAVDNCFIGNANIGISDSASVPMFDVGNAFYLDRRNHHNTFSRNTIGSATNPIGAIGMRIANEDGAVIRNNEITSVTGNSTSSNYGAGISVRDGNSVNLLINANKIHNIKAPNTTGTNTVAGIDIQQSSTVYTTGSGVNAKSSKLPAITANRVVNNMVYDLRRNSNGTTSYVPMSIGTINTTSYTVRNDSVYNNSIAVANAQSMITLTRLGTPFVWNNIFQNLNTNNSATSTLYTMTVPRPARLNVNTDYNLFDQRNASTFATLTEYDEATGTTTYALPIANLNAWRTLTQQDIHSVSGDPKFASDSLHGQIASSYVYSPASNAGAWLNSATQSSDFDGDVRTQTGGAPDMGADEFEGFQYSNDLSVLTITKPSGLTDNTGVIQVTAELPLQVQGVVRNLGSVAAPNRQVSAMVEQSTNSGASWSTVFSASKSYDFALNESKVVDFSAPMTPVASALYRITISVATDQYTANNSVSKIVKMIVKRNATLVSYNGSTAKGLLNRDSVTMALDRLGVKYDQIDRNTFGTNPIDYSPWWTIVWATGDPNVAYNSGLGIGAVSLKETEEITYFLRAGQPYAKKSFIIAGQNVAQYNDPNSAFKNLNNAVTDGDFMSNWMHTSFVGRYPVQNYPANLPTQYRGKLTGTGIYFVFADNILAESPDVIKPNPLPSVTGSVGANTSRYAYYYDNHGATPADSGAGNAWNGANYNVVFYPFDWADALQTLGTNDNETAASNVSGTTRFMRGALDFLKSFGGTVLPVEFSSVDAKAVPTGNLVSFSVASAKNVDRYEIETLVGSDWTSCGTVAAASQTNYSFLHSAKSALEAGKTYSYRVVAVDLDGSKTTSKTVNVDRQAVVPAFTMDANYPNPFRTSTTITYSLPSAGSVSIRILDLTGKVLATEIENESMTAGAKVYTFTATNLANGTYICEIAFTNADGETSVLHNKMTLSK